jgi:hypothetical protein
VKKSPKVKQNPFLVKLDSKLLPWKKVAKHFLLPLYFFKPFQVSNHQIGKHLANLVTLQRCCQK